MGALSHRYRNWGGRKGVGGGGGREGHGFVSIPYHSTLVAYIHSLVIE